MLEQPVEDHPQFGWSRVRKLAFGWVGLAVIFFWAFGEGVFWPLIAEMPLMLLIVTVGWRWRGLLLTVVACVGSALGVLTTWWLVDQGFNPPSPLTTPLMFQLASEQLTANPDTAFWKQMFNGIPVKVYAHEAGAMHLSLAQVMLALIPRMLRIAVIGVGTWMLGSLLSRWLKSCLGMVQGICLALFPFGLWLTVGYWS
jgi:membrane protein YqaA with SNARE-associated domain